MEAKAATVETEEWAAETAEAAKEAEEEGSVGEVDATQEEEAAEEVAAEADAAGEADDNEKEEGENEAEATKVTVIYSASDARANPSFSGPCHQRGAGCPGPRGGTARRGRRA